MTCLDQFSALVNLAYQAAAEPHLWPEFLAALSGALESPHIYFVGTSSALPAACILHLHNYPESDVQRYVSYYRKTDLLLDATIESVRASGFWAADLEGDLAARYRRSELFNDYSGPMGLVQQTCICAASSGPFDFLGVGLWRPGHTSGFSAQERHLFHLLFPHITQALHLHARLTSLATDTAAFRSGVEAAGTALLALDHTGRILSTSAAALALLQPSAVSCLRIQDGTLRATHAPTDRSLQRLIATTLAAANLQPAEHPLTPSATSTPGGSLLIPRLHAQRPLCLQITPFRSAAIHSPAPIAALIFLTDPDSTPPSRDQLLRDLFRLSPTEARLTDLLLQGLEVREAADRLRLSYDTARFHLKQVFRKTGTRRQSELLHLLARLPVL